MKAEIRISASFCIFAALCVLLLPLRWLLGAFVAALVHEVSHCLAIYFQREKIYSLHLTGMGARIETSSMSPRNEVLCALAGPLGSFSVLMAAEYFPEVAVCGLLQGLYNLLPIYPLDGGRAVRCLVSYPVSRGIELFFLVLLTGIGLWLCQKDMHFGLSLLVFLWYPRIRRKISCKESNLAVQ